MTAAPQKEYIITEEQLLELLRWYPVDTWGFEKGKYFRSRLYDPAAIPKERERVLGELKIWTRGNSETIEADDGTLEDAVFLGELLAKIEQLCQNKSGERVSSIIPEELICPQLPNANGFCTTPDKCISKRVRDDITDGTLLCEFMVRMRELRQQPQEPESEPAKEQVQR